MQRALLIFAALALPLLLQAQEGPPPLEKGKEETRKLEAPPVGYRGHEVDAAVHKLVQVQVEFIELPQEKLTEVLMNHSPAESAKLRGRVQELVKDGSAKILETQIVTGRSGEKLRSQSVQELIYPTEYQMWNDLHPSPLGGGLGGGIQPPKPLPAAAPFIPTSFETRNMGSTLEVEPILSADGKVIDMLIDPELTWYTGDSMWMEQKDTMGNTFQIQMPEIYSLSFHSALSLRAGATLFTAALTPKDGEGKADLTRKVMVFVKADVVP